LLKQTGDGSFEHVGTTTQWVPTRPDRTVEFPFAYTFSEATRRRARSPSGWWPP
jgi:hypothetical protein